MTKYEGKNEEIWRKNEEIWRNIYVENMKKYMENMKEIRAFKQRGRGKSYADADTIPGIAPSTERKVGSPAKKIRYFSIFDDIFCSFPYKVIGKYLGAYDIFGKVLSISLQ